jgi:MtN3 and saliva related transmembrane protein
MDGSVIIGFVAGVMTTGCQIPLAYKVYKTGSTNDLPTSWICVIFAGTAMWICYGLLKNDAPVIIFNSISIILLAYIASKIYR